MNLSHPMGVLHSFSIRNIFYDKMDVRLFYFHVTKWGNVIQSLGLLHITRLFLTYFYGFYARIFLLCLYAYFISTFYANIAFDYEVHCPALLDFFLFSDPSICSTVAFPPLRKADIVVSVSITLPQIQRGLFLFIAQLLIFSCYLRLSLWLCERCSMRLGQVHWADVLGKVLALFW